MWRQKTSYFLFALACFSLFVLAPLPGDAYLITGSEITQILDECATLRLELSILKEISQKDKASLQRLGESLEKVEKSLALAEMSLLESQNALTLAQEQLDAVKTQLDELKASLKQSKLAALWQNVKIGGICLGAGAAVGILIGMVIDK